MYFSKEQHRVYREWLEKEAENIAKNQDTINKLISRQTNSDSNPDRKSTL